MHWAEPEEQIEEGWETMVQLVEEGKVRYIGVSNYTVEQLKCISVIQKPVSLQPPYSMIASAFEDKLLPYCAANNIGVVCYSPMYKGLLTGKVTRERIAAMPADDHRRNDPHFNDPKLSHNLELVEGLKTIAKNLGITVIAWVLRWPEVTAAIVGARNPNQLQETAQAGNIELPADVITEIQGLMNG